MTTSKTLFKNVILLATFILVAFGCQKLARPVLPADYPQDKPVVPATSLRFYLNFDSTSPDASQLNIRFADSISGYPSFFPNSATTYAPGVRGTAYQGSLGTFLHYYNANDFGSSTSFTVAFWLNVTLAQKDNVNADGILALSSTGNFWSNMVVYADHSTGGNSDSMDLKFHFANGSGDNWDFAGYTGSARWPRMYDGQWHHVAFVYDATTKTATLYRDGVQFDKKTNETIAFDGKASQFVVGGFQEAVNIVDTYANNSWMSGFPGLLDNIGLYNVALSAADVAALFTNKQ